jgi:hypothetical protein
MIAACAGLLLWHQLHPRGSGSGEWKAQALPAEMRRILEKGERFELYSVEPVHEYIRKHRTGPPEEELFHNSRVLGKTEIHSAAERTRLLEALNEGIEDSDGGRMMCFNPRHAIRATMGDETVDLVICFECLSIQAHGRTNGVFLTTSGPLAVFNRALREAGLPLAEKP